MEAMRQSWTDERLDDLNQKVDRGFEKVDQRFAQVDRRFEQVDQRFDRVERELHGLRKATESGFDSQRKAFASMQQSMMQIGGLIIAALIGVIATQL